MSVEASMFTMYDLNSWRYYSNIRRLELSRFDVRYDLASVRITRLRTRLKDPGIAAG